MITHTTLDAYVGLGVVDLTPITSGAVPDLPAFCAVLADAGQIDVRVEHLAIAGSEIEVCAGHGDRGLGGFDPIEGYAALGNDLYLQIVAFHGTDEASLFSTVRELLATLLLK
jgi:hypothetical protein